jgi:hypothetical protein
VAPFSLNYLPYQVTVKRKILNFRSSLRHCLLSALTCGLMTSAPLSPWKGVSLASAQELKNEVAVQRFDPAPGPRNFITTRTARSDGQYTWSAAVMANYSYKPFVVTTCPEAEGCGDNNELVRTVPVVENMVTGDFYGSFTVIPQLQIGLKIPISWVKGQGITAGAETPVGGLSAVGMGDVQLEVKGRFYGEAGDPLVAGAYLYGTAPTGKLTTNDLTYIGNSSPTVGGAVIGDGQFGPLSFALNLGGIYRQTASLGTGNKLGPEGRWGAAVGYEIGPMLKAMLDAYGSTNFSTKPGGNSIEVDLGAQVAIPKVPIIATAGGGVGVLKGVGMPTARVFLGAMWVAEVADRDQDGLSDELDACPTDPEDMDGFEDSDGCPEFDNDNDAIADEADKCPDAPEDFDKFEDEDGCPDLDNDKDGILDTQDHCPLAPETMNGLDDLDGCPDKADGDGDGVGDDVDQCPEEPEDTDGYQDTDGCPDPDNDGDGILDDQDECIDLPEDEKGEGRELVDGCPIDA